MSRSAPNIIVTGTPGVGKTSHCELLATRTGLHHLPINKVVKEKACHDGWDDEYKSWVVDDDKLLDALEDEHISSVGGYIIDWHVCDIFPESWIDLVVVLRADSTVLYDRLHARDYGEKKLQENLDSEIWGLLLEEAKEGYAEEMIVELRSDGIEDIEANVDRIESWIKSWKEDRGSYEDGAVKEESS